MDIIDKVTYVTPNEHEAVLIFGDELSTENLLKKYPEKLVITQGSRGVSTCLKNGEVDFVMPVSDGKWYAEQEEFVQSSAVVALR